MRSTHDELKGGQGLTVVFAQNLDTFHFPGRTLRHLSGRGIPASRNHTKENKRHCLELCHRSKDATNTGSNGAKTTYYYPDRVAGWPFG